MIDQQCPNCFKRVDVSIYVSGQKVRCPRCRVPFVVTRASGTPLPISAPPAQAAAALEPAPLPSRARFEAKTTPSRPVHALRADGQPVSNAEAPVPPPPDAPEIPGYRIDALLGQGAMGTVYRATRLKDGVTVAIKMLAEQLQTNQEFVARFEREIAALAAVDHQGVVRLLEMSQVGERRFFAMEFVEGTSLRAEFSVTKPVPARVVSILRAVTRGLEAAHAAGVVHRDLKPENVMVEADGGIRIVDFGLAGLFGDGDPHPNLTRSRVTMGTVNYMAPEQRTDAKYVDQRADIYAVGVMLYEGLTGDLPVGRFQYPGERGLGLPMLSDTILARALAKEPRERYPDAATLLADLDKLAKVLKSAALADTALPRAPNQVLSSQVARRRRSLIRETVLGPPSRRWTMLAVASLLVAALGFAVGWWWLDRGDFYEVVVEGDRASRQRLEQSFEGPSLGLAPGPTVRFAAALGSWQAVEKTVQHRAVTGKVHLQPTFARAVVDSVAAARLQLQLRLRRQDIPVKARQIARADGYSSEARLDLPVRAGLGFAVGNRVVGGFIGSDGTCGYLDARGPRLEVWTQVCGSGGDQQARVELWREDSMLHLRVDDLHLPPHPVQFGAEAPQPVLLCQNAECEFSSAVSRADKGEAVQGASGHASRPSGGGA